MEEIVIKGEMADFYKNAGKDIWVYIGLLEIKCYPF